MSDFKALEDVIAASYDEGTTMEQAERLGARFLQAMLQVSSALRVADLDARMRKTGLKAIKAAVYLGEVQKSEKKPSDVLLSAIVDADELVNSQQERYDEAEVLRDELERYYNVFREAHVYYRGIAKGQFNG